MNQAKINALGIVGLGKMGLNLALNLQDHNFEVSGFDLNVESRQQASAEGLQVKDSLANLVAQLSTPRLIWVMVPAGKATDAVIEDLSSLLSPGDIIVDGGNSNFKDTLRRHDTLNAKGLHFLDCGTSGGTSGARYGACTMIGGDAEVFAHCEHLFSAISVENGYLYCGKGGSGHFVKMVHNGIEYGMMQAIAEGFEVLHKSPFDLDYEAVAKVWNHGSVIRSWLIELMQNAFSKDAQLDGIRGVMRSSGEGKWSLETALDYQVPTPVIALSLMMRYRSLEEDTFSGKVVAALRNEFGGHKVDRVGE